MGLSLLVFIFLPAALLSLGLAFIPWRPLVLRAWLLGLQVVATVFAVVLLPAKWEVWLFFLGPGAVVASLRGLAAAFDARDERRSRRS